MKRISLEKEALQFSEDNSKPPFLFEMAPEKGRQIVEELQ